MSNNTSIFKIWGERHRIFLTSACEIDYLKLKINTFCSLHFHFKKINLFYVLRGKIKIETEFGKIILKKGQSFEIHPPLKHRFVVLAKSEMIELAYTEKVPIDPNDINRISQGGKIINEKEYTLEELRKEGKLCM